jgi:predicted nucleic-acid-binding protein
MNTSSLLQRKIESEIEFIKNLFEACDRETSFNRSEIIRLKNLICSTKDHIKRHEYLKQYRRTEASFLSLILQAKETVKECKELLEELKEVANPDEGIGYEYELQELTKILNEHTY